MSLTIWALVGAIIAFVAAWPAAQRLRHPRVQPLAAWLIFLIVFVMVGGACLALGSYVVGLAGWHDALAGWVWAVAGVIAVVVPGVWAARLAVRREPRRRKVSPD